MIRPLVSEGLRVGRPPLLAIAMEWKEPSSFAVLGTGECVRALAHQLCVWGGSDVFRAAGAVKTTRSAAH